MTSSLPGRTATAVGAAARTGRAAWASLGACVIAVFMQMLDTTIVNTALPDIAAEVRAPGSAEVLVVAAYSLAFACSLLTAARLGESFGRRTIFLLATAGFVAASLWCGLATRATELIVARGVQGVFAAAMSAQTIAIVVACFQPARRTVAFALYGAAAGIAAMAGPLLGGVLVAADPAGLGWRAIFLVNVPLGAIGFALAYRYLAVDVSGEGTGLDPTGVVLGTAGLSLLLYPLAVGHEKHWAPELLVTLSVALLLLACFVAHQRRKCRAGGAALLDTGLFADPGFAAGIALTFVFFGLFAAFLFTVSVTAQTGLGFSALRTGLIMLPFALGGAVGALVSPTVAARWRSRTLTAGLAVFGLAVGTVAVVIRPETGAVDPVLLAAPVFLAGLGMGLFAAPLPAFALAGLGHRAADAASGVVPTMQQLGTSIGLAAGGVVFFARVDGQAADGVRHAAAVLDSNLAAAGVSTERRTRLVDDFADCVSSTLISPTPVSAPNMCRIGDPAVDGALDAAVRLATGQTFLAAYTTLLWIVAAVALALTVLTPVLRTPEQNHA